MKITVRVKIKPESNCTTVFDLFLLFFKNVFMETFLRETYESFLFKKESFSNFNTVAV